jgi:glycosyltransferase involved in cell wall biosynthesis
MVRNEADIVRLNIVYHLSLGIDRMIVVDNGSTDGTYKVLQQLSDRDPRVRWSRDDGPFHKERVLTRLAREAFREGADWVVPIDADEFWYAPGGDFRGLLENSRAGVLVAPTVNFIQRRSQRESSPDALLHMTRRAASPIPLAQDLVEARQIAFVEKMYRPKCVCRPTGEIQIETGHHKVFGANGPSEDTHELLCLHAPIRSRAALEERVRTANRPTEAGRKRGQGRYRRTYLAKFEGESDIEREWEANSYRGNYLDVYGQRHRVVFDPRLRDAVAPFIPHPFWKKLYWRLERLSRGSNNVGQRGTQVPTAAQPG